ncbi:MAG: hypothetical protein AB1925_17685 [Actinomycetota bacterium]
MPKDYRVACGLFSTNGILSTTSLPAAERRS